MTCRVTMFTEDLRSWHGEGFISTWSWIKEILFDSEIENIMHKGKGSENT